MGDTQSRAFGSKTVQGIQPSQGYSPPTANQEGTPSKNKRKWTKIKREGITAMELLKQNYKKPHTNLIEDRIKEVQQGRLDTRKKKKPVGQKYDKSEKRPLQTRRN